MNAEVLDHQETRRAVQGELVVNIRSLPSRRENVMESPHQLVAICQDGRLGSFI